MPLPPKENHKSAQLSWKQVVARGAIRLWNEIPPASFNKGVRGFLTLPVTGYRKTAHQAVSQGARRFGKRSISQDM
jgi:hypothetical protein